jgi:hypothetical protein
MRSTRFIIQKHFSGSLRYSAIQLPKFGSRSRQFTPGNCQDMDMDMVKTRRSKDVKKKRKRRTQQVKGIRLPPVLFWFAYIGARQGFEEEVKMKVVSREPTSHIQKMVAYQYEARKKPKKTGKKGPHFVNSQPFVHQNLQPFSFL